VSSQFTGIGGHGAPYKISVTLAARKGAAGWQFPVVGCKRLCHKGLVTRYEKITIFSGIYIDGHIGLLYDNDATQ
jgi:hypothetical protein